MKEFKKIFLLLLAVSLLIGGLYSTGWAADRLITDDPEVQGWTLLDLLVARPFSVLAGVGGSAIFVVTLPFTLPSGNTKDVAHMFIVEPFRFAFKREVPDKDISFGKNASGGEH